MSAAERFDFVPFGKDAPARAAACDGLVPKAALDLSHWEGNATPKELKRDTSTEIALAFARTGEKVELAVNNHFDADGALAVFALVRSDVALAHEKLFVAAAEAGDFDEWSTDEGIKLEAAVRRLGMLKTESDAYARVLRDLEGVLANLDRREDLWGSAWKALEEARAKLDCVHVLRHGAIATIVHPRDVDELAGPVLHRAIGPANAWLLAFEQADGTFTYRLEHARHAWADTVVRPKLGAPSRHAVAKGIERIAGIPLDAWAFKGELGMTGLMRTKASIATPPEIVGSAVERSLPPLVAHAEEAR